jgi:hypothetical protein
MTAPLPRYVRLLVVLAVFGCGGSDGPSGPPKPIPSKVTSVSGAGQVAVVGAVLPLPIVVQVTDAAGASVAGVSVSWTIVSGGGSVDNATVVTDASGQAVTHWTIGTVTGEQQLRATVGAIPAIVVTAQATPGPPADFVIAAGADQSAAADADLPVTLRVRLVDAFLNSVPNADVSWSVVSGGGSLLSVVTKTDSGGIATAKWHLGSRARNASRSYTPRSRPGWLRSMRPRSRLRLPGSSWLKTAWL